MGTGSSLSLKLFALFIGLAGCLAAQTTTPPPAQAGRCKQGVASFPTIQAAVSAAAMGATVFICPGTYPEQVTINKSLNVRGIQVGNASAAVIVPPSGGLVQNAKDPSPASLSPPIAAQIFVQGPATVNLTNLVVDGSNNQLSGCGAPTLVGIYYQNASGTLNSMNVRNEVLGAADAACDSGLGLYFESGSATPINLTISTVTNYQKNGITANGLGNGSPGPVVYFWGNEVVGQGPTGGAVQNGIQIGYGASGKLNGSIISDEISQSNNGSAARSATGVLVYATKGVSINSNQIVNTQLGVAVASDATYGDADGNTVFGNTIAGAKSDGIYVCSNANTIKSNQVFSSSEAGIRLESSCVEGPGGGNSGNANFLTGNTINGGCAGILGATSTGNVLSPNTMMNVFTSLIAGSTCAPSYGASGPVGSPSPFH